MNLVEKALYKWIIIIIISSSSSKGHSDLPESKFHVLTKFRPKHVNLHQLHFEFSTNLGLCQSNRQFIPLGQGSPKIGLPEVDSLDDIVTKENVDRMRRLERQKTDKAKKQLVTFKQN